MEEERYEKLFDKYYANNDIQIKQDEKESVEKELRLNIQSYYLSIDKQILEEKRKIENERKKIADRPLEYNPSNVSTAGRNIMRLNDLKNDIEKQYRELFGESINK